MYKGVKVWIYSKSGLYLQFKPNSHRLAERNLHRQGFESFLPMHTKLPNTNTIAMLSDLRATVPRLYVCELLIRNSGPWRQINCTIGVSKLVSFGGQPSPVPLDFISGLMLRCNSGGKLLPPNQLNKDDAVQLLTGPFANYHCKG